MKKLLFLSLLFSAAFCCAGTVRLLNDSPYKLRAMIRGADGTFLGEMIINPSQSSTWTDTYGQVGQFGKGTLYREGATKSQTPYSVLWYCMEGQPYSYTDIVSTGTYVSARGGEGARICKPKEDKSGSYPQNQQGDLLQPNDEDATKDLKPTEKPLYRYPEEED